MGSILVISADDARRIFRHLKGISAALDQLFQQGASNHMALSDDLNTFANRTDAGLSAVGTSLTGLAGDIHDLKNSIPSGPITAEQGAAISAKLEALAAKSEAIAAAAAGLDAETAPVVVPEPPVV